jgi:uncharacterized protein (DUF488 family)
VSRPCNRQPASVGRFPNLSALSASGLGLGLQICCAERCVRAVGRKHQRQKSASPDGAIFTVGHSTLPIESFIAQLHDYDVECLADIRTVPRSRHNPQFNADVLSRALKRQGIEYASLPALGGLRYPRKDSPNTGWRNKGFRGFADYMQTADFEDGLRSLVALGRSRRTAIMCAEAVPWRCHRSLVADALVVRGIPVVEILSEGSYQHHKLTPFARVRGTTITYPPEQASLI